ncbi:hypothetical protein CY35_18G087100 [Sphagnum magellanicum]|nr:hypothetical protein CY35_18G087100 [Sphagnum magellanicum]
MFSSIEAMSQAERNSEQQNEQGLERIREEISEKERTMSAGYESFDGLLADLQSSGHSQCTTVWSKDMVAYRCRTCQMNDSSAICEKCYHEGDHHNHDFVMYHSESGGCCDCGDKDAWKEEGFCKMHQVTNQISGHMPIHLYATTKHTVLWILQMLSIWVHIIWEKRIKDPKAIVEYEMQAAKLYIDWLQKVCSVDALRNLLSVFVTRKFVHVKNMIGIKSPLEILLKMLWSMPEALMEEETTFFLQMLYNGWFKSQFTQELMQHYHHMVMDVALMVIDHAQYVDVMRGWKALNSTLDRVMVQLFNIPKMELIIKENLLGKFIYVFKMILKYSLVRGIINVEHEVIKQKWMNPYTQNSSIHFKNNNAWILSIQLEMNTMAIIFQLITCCYSNDDSNKSKQALILAGNCTIKHLRCYLLEKTKKLTFESSMSLHIPLLRVFSVILSKLVLLSWDDDIKRFFSSFQTEEEVLALLDLPLRIIAWMVEIRANQWQHVSEEFYHLEFIYHGSFWHDQSWDMDLLLLQFCVVAKEDMENAIFFRMAERFHLLDLVTSPTTSSQMSFLLPSYIQNFLRIILLVVRDRRNTGMKELESLRYDVIQWLCVRNQTYSQLSRALSAIPLDQKKLMDTLDEVAQFHQPKVQEHGYYQLKSKYWKEFDPLFAHFYPNELEDAQERATHVGKLQHYWRLNSPIKAAPPYNQLTKLLHTQACHQLLWNMLNHVNFLVKDETSATAGESLGVAVLQIMEIALKDRQNFLPSNATPQPSSLHPNDILVNIKWNPYIDQGTILDERSTWRPRSSSMYDMLHELQSVKNAHHLADYAQHILHLLHSLFPTIFGDESRVSKFYNFPQYQVPVTTTKDEWQRLKKERQVAILAKISSQQKAFLDQHNDQEDDEAEHGYDDATLIEMSPILTLDRKEKFVTIETTVAIQECAFCRTKCDNSNSPAGYIAFVQLYNMPLQVVKKADEVENLEEAEIIAKGDKADQLLALVSKPIQPHEFASQVFEVTRYSLDVHPIEHVGCCGHQMHKACFESYCLSLLERDNLDNNYEGKGIIDLQQNEFWCPICRRLANVLLPIVNVSSFQQMQHVQKEGGTKDTFNLGELWNPQTNLSTTTDNFVAQVLWEVLARNIVHFEVETRDEKNEVGSSSSSSIQLKDKWGGEVVHLTTLQELGKLAMLFNKSDSDTMKHLKSNNIQRLWQELDTLCMIKEQLVYAYGSFDFISTHVLQKLREILEGLFVSGQLLDHNHVENKKDMKNQEIYDHKKSVPASIENGLGDSVSSYLIEKSQEEASSHRVPCIPNIEGGKAMLKPDCGPMGVQNLHKVLSEHLPCEINSMDYPSQQLEAYKHPTTNILYGGLLEVDPFAILTHWLLSAFEGWLDLIQILCMVKFAYIIAIIQTSRAITRIEKKASLEAKNIKSVIQSACLPFLRRATLLVQFITCNELDGKYQGSGIMLMDATYLEQSLQLQDIWRIFVINQAMGNNKQMRFECLQQTSNNIQDVQPRLYKVQKRLCLTNLPLVYQDLLWKSIKEQRIDHRKMGYAALCLICGEFVWCASEFQNNEECLKHANEGYAGIGIFLLMQSTHVLVIRGNRTCILPSFYLDQHGEEDHGLRRNQKLYLSPLRLNKVRRLWLTAGFDFDTHILHTSHMK